MFFENTRKIDPAQLKALIAGVSKALGYIVCLQANNDNGFVASAILIAPNVLLTARHVLSGFTCEDLNFVYNDIATRQTRFSKLALLEDGAWFGQDYVLLHVYGNFNTPIILTRELPIENSYFFCIKYFRDKITPLVARAPTRPPQQMLIFESPLKTYPGFSGAPYVSEDGKMFGLHLSGYEEHSMWAGTATGISFAQLQENLAGRNSILNEILLGIPSQPFRCNPYYFFDDDHIFSLPSLGQIDEGAREVALGVTPKLTSLTGTQVLLRYFLKGKAKLINNSTFTPQEIGFLNLLKNNLNKSALRYLGYRSFRDFKFENDEIICRLLSQINQWWVLVKMPQNGNLKSAIDTWVPLDIKKRRNCNVAGIQMGHKMGAVDYWVYGAGDKNKGWLYRERIRAIKAPKYVDQRKRGVKIQRLEQRYSSYRKPGYLDYKPNTKDRTFMKEPWNYHFQWWEINQHDGRLAGQVTRYKDYAPPGYRWKGSKLV